MSAVLDSVVPQIPSAPVDTQTSVAKQDPPSRFKFIQFLCPTQLPKVEIPKDTQHVILGIPGFLCTSAALKDAKEKLNTDKICYIDWGSVLNIGFTRSTTNYVTDFADYLAQSFGDQISVHGNSLGGFLAFRVAQTHPEIVNRLYLTASPHSLSMDPDDLHEHTNIGAFIGLMKSRILGRFYDQEMMKTWEDFVHNAVDDLIEEFNQAIDKIDIATFAATHDTTVNGKKCLFDLSEHRRSFAVEGDHVDVIKGAIPVIEYLADKDLHADLPKHIQSGLRPLDEVGELQRKSTLEVATNFVTSSIPSEVISTVSRSINAPIGLVDRAFTYLKPNSPVTTTGVQLAIEPRGLSLARAS